jgi:phosphoglycolate phosphatase-like HAD superfamily hydrolase
MEKDIRTAILTRSCREVLSLVFPDINDCVDAVVTREDVRYVKPHCGHTETAPALLSAKREEAIMVGDQVSDVPAGKAVGIRTVGVLTGKTGMDEFEAAHTDYILDDVKGLTGLMQP